MGEYENCQRLDLASSQSHLSSAATRSLLRRTLENLTEEKLQSVTFDGTLFHGVEQEQTPNGVIQDKDARLALMVVVSCLNMAQILDFTIIRFLLSVLVTSSSSENQQRFNRRKLSKICLRSLSISKDLKWTISIYRSCLALNDKELPRMIAALLPLRGGGAMSKFLHFFYSKLSPILGLHAYSRLSLQKWEQLVNKDLVLFQGTIERIQIQYLFLLLIAKDKLFLSMK
ncbi:hypothetical protein L6164_011518 [Bauhinia variegata]|uniref:Uncharacterized protein n=1 Tax=Bauhinia variegata TaxID=167791 RepID=A0ACB9P701_BAUVA|nr:hypothetical protein L6164_011518 [Bauhinia variegata]